MKFFFTLLLNNANEEWGFFFIPAVNQTRWKLSVTQYPVINYSVSPVAVSKDMSGTKAVKTEIYFKMSQYSFL